MASAKTAKVAAVAKGLAPTCSRRSSADHSIIAPSIRSAPIGTTHSRMSASEGRAKPGLRRAPRHRVVVDEAAGEEDRRRGEDRLQDRLLRQKADVGLGEGAADQRPGHGAEAPEGVAAGHDPPPERPLGLARLRVHRHLDGGDGEPADEEREPEQHRVRGERRPDEADQKQRAAPVAGRLQPEPRRDPADDEKAEHGARRHAEEAEGERQHVEPERRLHVRDARKPDRQPDGVQREDHLQGEEAGALGGHGWKNRGLDRRRC